MIRVFGMVSMESGVPMKYVTVDLARELVDGSRELAASASTDSDGKYEILYDPSVNGDTVIALAVVLPQEAGTPTKIIVSPSAEEEVDFRLGADSATGPLPLLNEIKRRVQPVLDPSQLGLRHLDQSGVARLAVASGLSPKDVAIAREAQYWASNADVSEPALFALGEAGLSATLPDVSKHSPQDRADALNRAVASGVLTKADAQAAYAGLAQLDSLAIESAVQVGTSISTPGHALQLANVPQQSREAVLQAWAAHQGTPDQFWDGLSSNLMTAQQKASAKFALQLQTLTRANAPMVDALFSGFANAEALAAKEPSYWANLAAQHGVPQHLSDAGMTAAQYGTAMFDAVEAAFPTKMLAARKTWFTSGTALENFLAGNASYDLAGRPLRELLRQNPQAIQAAGTPQQQAAVLSELPVLERLYRIAPPGAKFEVMRDLRNASISSAAQIALMGHARFIADFGTTLGAERAELVFRRARAINAAATQLKLRHGSTAPHAGFAVLPITGEGRPEGSDDTVGWEDMFGGRTFCDCGECESAHGPAAYLADLLFWLDTRGTDSTFRTELTTRRPDLMGIELSCKNANTAMPTIDLLLEQLEAMLVPENASTERQTRFDEAELAAQPEHVHLGAYDRLAGKTGPAPFYPFDQPYIAALDQTRTFLSALGTERAIAMLTTIENGAAGGLEKPEIAAEVLGMSRRSWAILKDGRSAPPAVAWGLGNGLLTESSVWAASAGATVETGKPDANGGHQAVRLVDTDGSYRHATLSGPATYRSGAPVSGSILVKKDVSANNFIEIRVGFGATFNDGFALHLGTGVTAPRAGTMTYNATAFGDGSWWLVTFSHAGGVGQFAGLRVYPAVGQVSSFPSGSPSATGGVTLFLAQLFEAATTSQLEQVPVLLHQAGDRAAEQPLTYEALEDLLRSQFVQDAGALSVQFDNSVCDISGAQLVSSATGGFDAHLERLAALIRLARDLGWSIADTDRAIETFRGSSSNVPLKRDDLSEHLLLSLASVRWLERMLGKQPQELLSWWGTLDTRRWKSRIVTDGQSRVFDPLSAGSSDPNAEPSPFQRMVGRLDREGIFTVTTDGKALTNETRLLKDHVEAIASVLGTDPAEVSTLIRVLGSSAALTLDSLSRLHAQVSLARALGLTAQELLDWTAWTGIDPFASPLETVRFAIEVRRQASVGIDHESLAVLLAPSGTRELDTLSSVPSAADAVLALTDEVHAHRKSTTSEDPPFDFSAAIESTLDSRNLLEGVGTLPWWPGADGHTLVTTGAVDPLGESHAVTLEETSGTGASLPVGTSSGNYGDASPLWASLWVKKDADAEHFTEVELVYDGVVAASVALHLGTGATAVRPGTPPETPVVEALEVRDGGDWWFLAFRHAGATTVNASLRVHPASGLAVSFPVASATTTGITTVFGARIAKATDERGNPLSPRVQRERAIVRRLASMLSLEVDLLTGLLEGLYTPSGKRAFDALMEAVDAVADFRDAYPYARANAELLAAELDAELWELIVVSGWLCRAVRLHAKDLPWLLAADPNVRGFELATIVSGSAVTDRYASWAKLREAARLQQVTKDGLYDLVGELASGAIDATAFGNGLAERTGWSEADVQDAMTQLAAGWGTVSWAHHLWLPRLVGVLELASAMRVPAGQLVSWGAIVWDLGSNVDPFAVYETHAAQLEKTLRATWGKERWLRDMPAIRNGLRERQRKALVSRLVGDPASPFGSALELGEHLLMDVHTGVCERTSRIKDAIRTVQTFVQRVLLGEEGTLRLTEEEAKEWEWRKNYRVWEANRKVFLYPENWLRPELRRDKTPLFEQLESELSQGDLRDELVEASYRTYLRGLSDISKMEVLAILREERVGSDDVFHLFARTRGIPTTYYHRTWTENGRWTPWRELPRVEGEHLIPVAHRGRVFLFWLNISVTAKESRSPDVPEAGGTVHGSPKYFNIRLSSSELRDGKWTTASMSEQYIGVDANGRVSPPNCGALARLQADDVAPTCICAEADKDANGRDLLIRLYMDDLFQGDIFELPLFRVSTVDRSVSVERPRESMVLGAPPRSGWFRYAGHAQRFRSTLNNDPIYGTLDLPFRQPSAGQPTLKRLLDAGEVRWMQVTPGRRGRFDATEPFAFEDKVGTYWVTFEPAPKLRRWIGFDPQMALREGFRLPPILAQELQTTDWLAAPKPLFKNVSTNGLNALTPPAAVIEAMADGRKVAAFNGQAINPLAPTYALHTEFEVTDPNGNVVYGAKSASGTTGDLPLTVLTKLKVPLVSTNPTPITQGFHILRSPEASWRFHSLFHPHVAAMTEALNLDGVFGLLDAAPGKPLEDQDPTPESTLASRYDLLAVHRPPTDELDFSATGAYSQYNWEIFFHAPFLIASKLHEARRFEEALKWIRVIFDPARPAQASETGVGDAAYAYWRFRPFREEFASGGDVPKNIQQIIALLTADGSDPDALDNARDLLQQLADWRRNPFDPHAIARTRTLAYMTAVVMRYLEILIDWADQLFAQDTLESIGQAAELYFMAARILGPRPEGIDLDDAQPRTFADLLTDFTSGSGPSGAIEEILPDAWEVALDDMPAEASSLATLLYFCTPANPQLRSRFWDRVADRLFKIRNCLDIAGQRRELALFEPPIDPDLLVRATATGVDLRTMLSEIVIGRTPHRRYLAMAELAAGLASGAQALGQAMLGAIEKRDADQLAILRSTHERRLHEDTIRVRKDQITELELQLEAMRHNREGTLRRLNHYKDRPRTNAKEAAERLLAHASNAAAHASAAASTTATIVGLIPTLDIGSAGFGGTPKVSAGFGGPQLAAVASAHARILDTIGGLAARQGGMLLTESGYDRRQEEWQLQADLADKELAALDKRIVGLELQIAMAKRALESANVRMKQIEEVHEILERRFGGEELYDWLQSQLTGLHHQSYQLAYEFAKRAEKAWQYELGRNDTFIRFGYWDGSRKGLLAAERLAHDLRRMQVAYTDISTRRLEVDQTFSLRDVDPAALLKLQETGEADFELPEALFDLYYPGHYCRRIRAVRLTVPAVVPPNTPLPLHLSLVDHFIRKGEEDSDVLVAGGYGTTPVTKTAMSTGQRDAGVFELDFRGPRLLPFEGAGAVSKWRVKLPNHVRPFDYRQIQDVLVHVAYDSEYSDTLRGRVDATSGSRSIRTTLFQTTPPRRRVISLRQEHGGALRRLIQSGGTVQLHLGDEVYPSYLRQIQPDVQSVQIALRSSNATPIGFGGGTTGTWGTWAEAGGLQIAPVALPPSFDLTATHDLTITNWGSVEKNAPHFDILIVIDFAG